PATGTTGGRAPPVCDGLMMSVDLPFRLPRRTMLRLAGLGALLLPQLWPKHTSAKDHNAGAIRQPGRPGPPAFIARAFEMRRQAEKDGDQAYGAVVVKDNTIVGQAPSRVVINRDPTAHAEMQAIRDAARRLGNRDLSGCVLYSSSKPCPMCEAAAYWAGIERLIYGRDMANGGAPSLCG
ncbi:MAG TPA: nucleoside deaminase, partial [Afifellaceae bacterium]|nr:nucleoside deaminase [Afifellaceae bacterium]